MRTNSSFTSECASRPHLLFLSHRIPYPPNKGDKIRSYHLLKQLARDYRVHLGTFVDDKADFKHEETLRDLCESILLIPLSPVNRRIASLKSLLTGDSITVHYYRSRQLQTWVDNITASFAIERALVFSSSMFIRA